MADLIYSAIASLDGYIADVDGKFDWAEPDEEVHAFINDRSRPIGTYLLGRRMYEVLVSGRTRPLSTSSRPTYRSSRRSGRPRRRSCTPEHSRRRRLPRRGSSDTSTLRRSGNSKLSRNATSPLAAPISPPKPSGLDWSTNTNSSSCRSSWEPASTSSPALPASSSSCWTNAGSVTAPYSFTTALGSDELESRG